MKIVSWNVNSIRKGVTEALIFFCESENPDIICFQETKCTGKDGEIFFRDNKLLDTYKYRYWNDSIKGHHGVAIFSKTEPIETSYNIPDMEHCSGRVILLEYDTFTLLNTYVPNTGTGTVAEEKRKKWHEGLLNWLKERTISKKFLIWCGDLNVVREPILDTSHKKYRLKDNSKSYGGMKIFEYEHLCEYLNLGLYDIFRTMFPETQSFTWFSNYNDKVRWRLDYFFTNDMTKIENIVHCKKFGKEVSDHSPLFISLSEL
jgi:exodeoxyribonuclease III